MTDAATVHLRVPAALKARWVRDSRAAGMRLTDWLVGRIDGAAAGQQDARLTAAQFAALAELAGLRSAQTRLAAELVLVLGLRPADAARESGLSQQAACNALARLRLVMDLARATARA